MAKGNKATRAATPAATPAATQAQAVLVVGARGAKYNGKDATKHGTGGTAGTWAAVQAAVQANGGSISYAALRALTAAQGDKGFAAYAVRNMWLVPQAQP